MSLVFSLLALASGACSESEGARHTMVTARIYIATDVRARMSQLRVRSYRSAENRFVLRAEDVYATATLDPVVDVSFTPHSGEYDGTVLVVADALADGDQVLVQARATFVFVPGEQRLFELWLYRCGSMELGSLCSGASCADGTCLTCVRDHCAATPLYAKPQLVSFDPSQAADPDKAPPGLRQPDAGGDPERMDAGADAPANAAADGATADGSGPAPECANGTGANCPPLATLDATTEPSSDAALGDSGLDASRLDAEVRDASEAGPDAQEPPGRCALPSAWTSVEANAVIPALARSLAQHSNASGNRKQYLCRILTPDGLTLAPGKVSGSASMPTRFSDGCYSTFYGPVSGMPGSSAWQSFGVDAPGSAFQVYTPPSECQLDWVSMTAGQALPSRALAVGNTAGASPAPIYACRVRIQDSMTMGTHIGRVGAALGDLCRVQYYQQPPVERSAFEVLVQTRP